ncbi:hypothetical protein L1049_020307 [Liquidambar formosana]|uniref:beta-fructofuranosidase n=1 Tax=Liquidambar formosana TaxID=63359 RepID=A0AAP0S7R8_LIQFO
MDMHPPSTLHDPENASLISSSYTPLPSHPQPAGSPAGHRRPIGIFTAIAASVMFLMSLIGLILNQGAEPTVMQPLAPSEATSSPEYSNLVGRGVAEGVSEKSYRFVSEGSDYNWTNAMLSWQRTAYHFQPVKNWMNGGYKFPLLALLLYGTMPRVVAFDNKTRTNLLQWPVEEVESLRMNSTEFSGVDLEPGSVVPLSIGMATQVDHSVVESFGQGGRTVITSRIYPTVAIYGAARVFLFNNATEVNVTASLKIWQLNSAFIHPFPLDEM